MKGTAHTHTKVLQEFFSNKMENVIRLTIYFSLSFSLILSGLPRHIYPAHEYLGLSLAEVDTREHAKELIHFAEKINIHNKCINIASFGCGMKSDEPITA